MNSHVYYLPLTGGKLRPISVCEVVAELELAIRGHSLQASLLLREGGRALQEDRGMHTLLHPGAKYTNLEQEGFLVCPST